jgi:hypothetical protein
MKDLVRWFEGLPLEATTGVMAALGVPIAVTACLMFRRRDVRWIVAVAGPCGVAFCVYWYPPLMKGSDLSEYVAWAPVFIGIWGAAGGCVAALVVLAWSVVARRMTSRPSR